MLKDEKFIVCRENDELIELKENLEKEQQKHLRKFKRKRIMLDSLMAFILVFNTRYRNRIYRNAPQK